MDKESRPLLINNSDKEEEIVQIANAQPVSSPPTNDNATLLSSLFRKPSNEGLWRWLKWRLLPVELVLFLYFLGVYFQIQTNQQYVLQRMIREHFTNWSSISRATNISVDHVCLKQDFVENVSSVRSYIDIQTRVNILSIVNTLTYLVPCIMAALVLTPLSDRCGRKPIMLSVLVGQTLSSAFLLVLLYFDLSLWLFAVTSFLTGITGGFSVITAGGLAYITDVTPKRWLALRIGVVEAFIFIANGVASDYAESWIQLTRCNFESQFWTCLVISCAGLLYTLTIPESLGQGVEQGVESHSLTSNAGKSRAGKLLQGFKIYFNPSYLGFKKQWQLWALTLARFLAMICDTGTIQILSYFLVNKPLLWDYGQVGTYMLVTNLAHLAALVLVLPVLVACRISNTAIALVGTVFAFAASLYISLLNTTAEMFTAGVIIGVEAVIVPGIRASVVSLLNRPDETGAAFSILGAFNVVATVVSVITFNLVYTPDVTINNKRDPKTVYWIMSGVWGTAVVILMVLVMYQSISARKKCATSNETIRSIQKEHLS